MIEPVKLFQNFGDLFLQLKGTLDDDWNNELRFASVLLVKKIMEYIKDEADHEVHRELYEQLLKRLDDAQDFIRIETAKAFEVFFDMIPENWSNSLYDYTVKHIFIHLDDNNEQVRDSITKVLMKAARICPDIFLDIATDCQARFTHKVLCQNLVDHCKNTYKK